MSQRIKGTEFQYGVGKARVSVPLPRRAASLLAAYHDKQKADSKLLKSARAKTMRDATAAAVATTSLILHVALIEKRRADAQLRRAAGTDSTRAAVLLASQLESKVSAVAEHLQSQRAREQRRANDSRRAARDSQAPNKGRADDRRKSTSIRTVSGGLPSLGNRAR